MALLVLYVVASVLWLVKQSKRAGEYGRSIFSYETKGERFMYYLTFPVMCPILIVFILVFALIRIPMNVIEDIATWWDQKI